MSSIELAPAVPLTEVEWRVDGKPSKNGTARFVPYVDATTTARLLDEWVGPGNWSDRYEPGELAGKPALWCYLSIKVGDEWVTKRDVGVPSNFEAQKGMVSDAFKRVACIKWGVARNVYSLPTLWAPCRIWKDNKGNDQASPNDQTLPAIHRELKKLGYQASGRLSASVEEQQEGGVAGSASASTPQSQADGSASSEVSGAGTDNEGSGQGTTGTTSDAVGISQGTGSTAPAPASGSNGESGEKERSDTAPEPQGDGVADALPSLFPATDLVEVYGTSKVLLTARKLAKATAAEPPLSVEGINEALASLVGKELEKQSA